MKYNIYKINTITCMGHDITKEMYILSNEKEIKEIFKKYCDSLIKKENIMSDEEAKNIIGNEKAIILNELKAKISTTLKNAPDLWDSINIDVTVILEDVCKNLDVIQTLYKNDEWDYGILKISDNIEILKKELKKIFEKEKSNGNFVTEPEHKNDKDYSHIIENGTIGKFIYLEKVSYEYDEWDLRGYVISIKNFKLYKLNDFQES